MSQKNKGRKFFQQIQPTFSIDLPTSNTTELEFLDHSDPSKDTVVRKKAREWVNKNKQISKQSREGQSQLNTGKLIWEDDQAKKQGKRPKNEKNEEKEECVILLDPLQTVGTNLMDPFNLLPTVGRKYDHIIEFFLTSCPEEIPCSDDKYSDQSKHPLVAFSRNNTVLGNMARSKVTFVLWLYATVSIRDCMQGFFDTEEMRWFYNEALKAMRKTVKEESKTGKYTDHLLNALSCITATASFSGMFKTAELHRNAMIRVLALRGRGDILKGLRSAEQWSIKAAQWCEIMVATQLVEIPKIPYLSQASSTLPPPYVTSEAARLTSINLSNLPRLSECLHNIIHLLHHLGIAYAQPRTTKKIDSYVIGPLYEAEYAILQLLSAQKQRDHGYSEVEVLLAEAFQLYFWTGPRCLPPQLRLGDLLISRIMRALLPLLLETVPDVDLEDNMPETPSILHQETSSILENIANFPLRTHHHFKQTNNAILWSLALGTIVSASLNRPEHSWFREHFELQLGAMGLDASREEFEAFLELFPTTEGFAWIDLRTLYDRVRD